MCYIHEAGEMLSQDAHCVDGVQANLTYMCIWFAHWSFLLVLIMSLL